MTEIPEHLLKRSRERRAAVSGDSDGGDSGTAKAASTPATTTDSAPAAPTGPQPRAAAPEPDKPEPPKPDTPVIAAYKRRRRIPAWAMLGLCFLPVWAFMYVRAVTTQAEEVAGPLAVGAETYGVCASCHMADGSGGASGYQFSDGEVLKTFPHIEDQLRFVDFGTEQYNIAGVEIYGDPNREGGAHVTGALGAMPAQGGTLSDAEILGVVCHERFTLAGAADDEAYAEEFERWCSEDSVLFEALDSGSATLADLDTAVELDPPIMPIGDTPIPGSPAGDAAEG